ncbi:MAG: phosphatidylglycerophosphatase A [Candidatus Omnitrophica bacterium]|nr:phosphatidylglycerophosphatase A [Candidatus Omnitrophota bacterium]
MNEKLIKLLATFFGAGLLPLIEGTWGSLAGIIVYFLFLKGNSIIHLCFFLIITVVGFAVCAPAERIFKKKDAGAIVIDEVAGISLSLLFIPPKPLYILIGFFLFRLYDTIKPPPTHSIEKLSGSYGIMGDDLIAGVYTNISLHIIIFVLSFSGVLS